MYERAVELERAHRYGDALQAFVACGARDEIVALLDEKGSELLEQGHIDTIASAINSVLAQNKSIPARLATLLGTIEARRGRKDISDAWFREASANATSSVETAEIAYRHGCALTSRSNGAACVELLAPIANQTNLPAELRASILAVLAVADVFLKLFEEAKSAIAQSLQILDEHAPPAIQAQVCQHAAWVNLFIGDIRAARLLAPEAARLAIQNSVQDIAASASRSSTT